MAHLIDKSALVAEIERLRKNQRLDDRHGQGVLDGLHAIEKFIDTLEVKEVDLNNEYIEEIYSHIDDIKETADRMTTGNFMHHRAAIKFSANTIAKVLELMGLKAPKGE